jgi:hypothetical protein
VSLAAAASSRVTGQLLLTFQPGVSNFPADPAIQFATGGSSAPFEIAAGQTNATFGADTVARLQTGTTAGTLVLTARAGSRSEESRLTLARTAAKISAIRATRSGTSLEVQATAFDNTRTLSQVGFTFFDTAGRQIGDPIRVDVADAFLSYFRSSAAGGAFSMKAVFPVTNGDVSQVAAVEAEILNGSGTGRSERVRF